MKLKQLMELVQPNYTHKKTNLTLKTGNVDNQEPNTIGQGSYSTVSNDRTDPHMVKKHHYVPLDGTWNDGYVKFIDYLIDNNISAINLPRIYDVKRITDKSNKSIYKYKLEKLFSSDDVSLEEMKAFVDRTIDQELTVDLYSSDDIYKDELLRQFGIFIQKSMLTNDYSKIKDDELIKTLKIIKSYVDQSDGELEFDIGNSSNLMFRRGRTGLQLVISDPFG